MTAATACSNNELNKANNNNELMGGSGESKRDPQLKKCEKKKNEKKKKPKKSESKEDKPRNGVNEDVAGDNAVQTLIDLIRNGGNNGVIENVLGAFDFFWNVYEQEVQQHGNLSGGKNRIILFSCSIRRFVLGKGSGIEIRDLFEAFRVFFLSNGEQMSSAQILRSFVFMLALSGQSFNFIPFTDEGVGDLHSFHVERQWLDKEKGLKMDEEAEWLSPFIEDCRTENWKLVERFLWEAWSKGINSFLDVLENPMLITIYEENNNIKNGICSILERIIENRLWVIPGDLWYNPFYTDSGIMVFYRFLNVIYLHRGLAQYGFRNIGVDLYEWLRTLGLFYDHVIVSDDIDQEWINWED